MVLCFQSDNGVVEVRLNSDETPAFRVPVCVFRRPVWYIMNKSHFFVLVLFSFVCGFRRVEGAQAEIYGAQGNRSCSSAVATPAITF